MISLPEDPSNFNPNQVILVDKPAGLTSFGVVARLKRVFKNAAGKKVKVGHTGTLDPFATGLMIIVTGNECKNAMSYSKLDKWYDAEFTLGASSTTGDPEGEITEVGGTKDLSQEMIEAALEDFRGPIMQRPPIFSAIKIDGQRAYKLARKGEVVEIPERRVEIYHLEIISYSYPLLNLRMHVSSGTYVRSLAVDLAARLGTGAYCSALRRTKVGNYKIEDAKTLADFGITS